MNDRNKTALTHRVTALAAAALDGLGCKPVETEVPISPGWVADVASYRYPTLTEAKRFGFNGTHAGPLTVVCEVKTTRADFIRDRKWLRPAPAHVCIVAYPVGIVTELPAGWYGLETTMTGDRVRKWYRANAGIHPQRQDVTIELIAQVGIRRDHRTRHAVTRDRAKASRARDAEQRIRYAPERLLEGLAYWLQGNEPDRPLREVLPELGVKELPDHLDEVIEYFEKIRGR